MFGDIIVCRFVDTITFFLYVPELEAPIEIEPLMVSILIWGVENMVGSKDINTYVRIEESF